jgi:hypothetical protein
MASRGISTSYQHFRNISRFLRSKGIPERQIRFASIGSDRQQDNNGIHKQNGGNPVCSVQSNSHRSMAMVFAKKHYNKSRSHSRSPKSIGRLGIKTSLGFQQLDVESTNISKTFV